MFQCYRSRMFVSQASCMLRFKQLQTVSRRCLPIHRQEAAHADSHALNDNPCCSKSLDMDLKQIHQINFEDLVEPPLIFDPRRKYYVVYKNGRISGDKVARPFHQDPEPNYVIGRGVANLQPNNTIPNHSIVAPVAQHVNHKINVRKLPGYYLSLGKARLSAMVVATAAAGYYMCPGAFVPLDFALCCLGTAAMSLSANAINQSLEVSFDSQMKRTRSRVLVLGQLSNMSVILSFCRKLHAVSFGIGSGLLGCAILYLGVNPLTAALGATNILLYTLLYTPMKRYSIANTWVGAIVGAIPPLMGYAACSASGLTSGALVMASVLYAWQFPHFNSLSWNLRPDYSQAGYCMMCVTNPQLCLRTTLRYSVALAGLCSVAAPLSGLTDWIFALDSLPLNVVLIYLSWRFYKEPDSSSSRKLFRYSLVYLPTLMLLMLIGKKTVQVVQ